MVILCVSLLMTMIHFIPQKARKTILEWAQNDTLTVCLLGLAGSGKSAIARWIHGHSPRSMEPFTIFNPGADLYAALENNPSGTLYIEEVAQLPLKQQKRMMEFMKHRMLKPEGGIQPQRIFRTRIIAGSDENMEKRVRAGMFSDELLAILEKNQITLPTLSERGEDFDSVALGLLHELALQAECAEVRSITPEALAMLKEYPWPGNMRELRNVLWYGIEHCKDSELTLNDLPDLKALGEQFRATRSGFESWLASQGIREKTDR
ncbi:MAG: sigma 54-interacting transcriptional regulator [Xanthomonadaceae bacterium]|nr:sigma 54-interacting transcriptional regulator [Xanthomonadaceae bacterium]